MKDYVDTVFVDSASTPLHDFRIPPVPTDGEVRYLKSVDGELVWVKAEE